MKIIKPGNPKTQQSIKGRCGYCGCKFTFKASEARREYDPRDHIGYYIVQCPQPGCNEGVIIYDR